MCDSGAALGCGEYTLPSLVGLMGGKAAGLSTCQLGIKPGVAILVPASSNARFSCTHHEYKRLQTLIQRQTSKARAP
jgi:hypothetical protein